MKKLLMIMMLFLFLSCDKDVNFTENYICGCKAAKEELPWLKELINKANTDTTGNYKGTIWFLNYQGQDMFVTDMMMGSGGILYYYFDCKGDKIKWDTIDRRDDALYLFTQKLKTATHIYSNIYD